MPAAIEPTAPHSLYYLHNFHSVLNWIERRYCDLLSASECSFIDDFRLLPTPSQALLIRMVMRTRTLFRCSTLNYAEIGEVAQAAAPLVELGWIDDHPALRVDELFQLLNKQELASALCCSRMERGLSKALLLEEYEKKYAAPQVFACWWPASSERVYHVLVAALCERFRVMYFGNFRQTWAEFVLADLGIHLYERLDPAILARPFNSTEQIDQFLAIVEGRRQLEEGAAPDAVLARVPAPIRDCEWLEQRREKLLFLIGRALERMRQPRSALPIYQTIRHPGAAERASKITSGRARSGDLRALTSKIPAFDVHLQQPTTTYSVERLVMEALTEAGEDRSSIHYVENMLINSLFGLLCWRAIFAPVPGAFFHPFHREPADLSDALFFSRRSREFAECFAEFDAGTYKATIRRNFVEKAGRASPFVAWRALKPELLDLALECLPAAHLLPWFLRIAENNAANRAGCPDLIQFWPDDGRYRMIEVKAPGDRLQTSQQRCLAFCVAQQIPVSVCNVKWLQCA
jgi:VRR-NUC domain/Fanconi anemia-associated nuclease SAP domain